MNPTQPNQTPPASPPPAAPTPPGTAGTPKKIMIIEDETFIADLYSLQFQKVGFKVRVANNGTDGLKALEEEPFDILLLDIMLPDINGLEILRQWKLKHPSAPMIVLLLTNLGQDAVIKEAFTLGAQGYLIKSSLTPVQVVNEVNNALAGKSSSGPK